MLIGSNYSKKPPNYNLEYSVRKIYIILGKQSSSKLSIHTKKMYQHTYSVHKILNLRTDTI